MSPFIFDDQMYKVIIFHDLTKWFVLTQIIKNKFRDATVTQ